MTDWLTWQQSDRDTEQMRGYLVKALARSGLCVMLQDGDLNYIFIANLFDHWEVDPASKPTDRTLFGDQIASQLADLKAAVLDTGEPDTIEISIGANGLFEFNVERLKEPDEAPLILTRIIDLTDRQVAERVTKTLLREVSHRSKNLLAIVQSIASQTARHSGSLQNFLKEFRGRLQSLSQAQDLVTEASWRGAPLHDLVARQAAIYLTDGVASIELKGDNVKLEPNAVIHIGLALHELIFRAVTDGAFNGRAHKVSVECSRTKVNGQDSIKIDWRNRMPDYRPPDRKNGDAEFDDFGRILLERVVPASINGTASFSRDKSGMQYQLIFPVSHEVPNPF